MEELINELKELNQNHDMGFITENEYFNQCLDVIIRGLSLPSKVGENFKVDMAKFQPFIDKLIS